MAVDKQNLKKQLEAAKTQIDNAVKRVDTASPDELHEIKGLAHVAAAFVDFNSGCK